MYAEINDKPMDLITMIRISTLKLELVVAMSIPTKRYWTPRT